MFIDRRVDMLKDELAKPIVAIHKRFQILKLIPFVREECNDIVRESFGDRTVVALRISPERVVNQLPSFQGAEILGLLFE